MILTYSLFVVHSNTKCACMSLKKFVFNIFGVWSHQTRGISNSYVDIKGLPLQSVPASIKYYVTLKHSFKTSFYSN